MDYPLCITYNVPVWPRLCHGLPIDGQGEPQAYSLVGLFGVYMEIHYGEKENVFQRLQEAVIKEYNDHSIFAWFDNVRNGSILANNPSCFLGSFNVVRLDPPVAFASECPTDIALMKAHRRLHMTKRGIKIWLPITSRSGSHNAMQAKLACCRKGDPNLITINHSVKGYISRGRML